MNPELWTSYAILYIFQIFTDVYVLDSILHDVGCVKALVLILYLRLCCLDRRCMGSPNMKHPMSRPILFGGQCITNNICFPCYWTGYTLEAKCVASMCPREHNAVRLSRSHQTPVRLKDSRNRTSAIQHPILKARCTASRETVNRELSIEQSAKPRGDRPSVPSALGFSTNPPSQQPPQSVDCVHGLYPC